MRALDGASLTAFPGEVHAVLGENGAGKSTLAHVLGGLVRLDRGQVRVDGKIVRLDSPAHAAAQSIGLVHQHFKLVPTLTALENIALVSGGSPWRLPLGSLRREATAVAQEAGLQVDLDATVEFMSVGAKQRVEIVKLLLKRPRFLVLDEPTAVLAPSEVSVLLHTLNRLAAEGRTVLLIGHKLDEVLSVADRVTVLRSGRTILSAPRTDVDAAVLTRAMVGEVELERTVPAPRSVGESIAALAAVSVSDRDRGVHLAGVSMEARRGEIVGVAGVAGNGQRELALVLAGRLRPRSGVVVIPEAVGLVPQDRSLEGLAADLSLTENVALALHDRAEYRSGPLLDWARIRGETTSILDRFQVVAAGPDQPARTLSGGNQQRMVVGREVERSPDLLVLENPTRGLDIAATAYVRGLLTRLRGQGESAPAIVLISTDLDEVLALADRVLVMHRGRLIPVEGPSPSRETVGSLMLAGREDPASAEA